MAALAKPHYTPEEYLALERAAEYKSEYINGEIYAMAGASRAHILLCTNLVGELYSRFKKKPCEVYSSEMRVQVSSTGMYTYPDIVITCGNPHLVDDRKDTLLNPTVIIEVLSPSTEAYDRGLKFMHYRKLDSLLDYVLVSQDKALAEHFVRRGEAGNEWMLTYIEGLDGVLRLESIGCEVALRDIYDRVEFPSIDTGPQLDKPS